MKARLHGYCVIFDNEDKETPVKTYIPFNQITAFEAKKLQVRIISRGVTWELNFSAQRTADDFVNRLSQQMRYCAMGAPCA